MGEKQGFPLRGINVRMRNILAPPTTRRPRGVREKRRCIKVKVIRNMGHQNVWYSHPRKYGPGSRQWYVDMICLAYLWWAINRSRRYSPCLYLEHHKCINVYVGNTTSGRRMCVYTYIWHKMWPFVQSGVGRTGDVVGSTSCT